MPVKRFVKRLLAMLWKAPPPPPRRKWQEFSIGIYVGKSTFEFGPHEQAENPVRTRDHVSDVQASFVADPFMLHASQSWYMFFEVRAVRASSSSSCSCMTSGPTAPRLITSLPSCLPSSGASFPYDHPRFPQITTVELIARSLGSV
jgi:hypothetical protein